MADWTHRELCTIAARWLRDKHRCHGAVAEPPLGFGEIPDAFGWTNHGVTHVVEVKVTRSDFKADHRKPFRRNPAAGMGDFRWYMAPIGLLSRADIPPEWGLVSVSDEGRVRVVKKAVQFGTSETSQVLTNFEREQRAQAKRHEQRQHEFRHIAYIGNRLAKYGDLDPETLRFTNIREARKAAKAAREAGRPT